VNVNKTLSTDKEYLTWLRNLKSRIQQSQIKASIRVNSAMLELYWSIDADIVSRQAESVWGSGVLQKLSPDIRNAFPDMQGFSERNLKYMRQFYEYYSRHYPIGQQSVAQLEDTNAKLHHTKSHGQQLVAQLQTEEFSPILGSIPWGHHIAIFTHCKSIDEALFYLSKVTENSWSRAMLLNFLDTDLYGRQGKATNNFSRLLPQPQSDLAREILKDPYNFDFITLTEGHKEKELENALTSNITEFLLELGQGFAYVGRQVPIMVGKKEMFIDYSDSRFIPILSN
jgi:predicted nuclease of restriction endonuclease-like (RecB) superfamily